MDVTVIGMNVVEVRNLKFGYGSGPDILDNINLDIKEGEYVTLLGHNGSGKSTLAKLLIGLSEKRSGSIVINGLELNDENINRIREKIGIVFQNPDNQFVGVTVRDDIAFGLENRRIEPEIIEAEVLKYAKSVKMEDFLDCNPEELSGGQKQRVAIAGVLAFKPDIIIFDEATSMLDPAGVREVTEIIGSLIGKKTIISITHNLNEAKMSDRVIVLSNGTIVLDGKPEEVFRKKETLEKAGLDITESMKLIELISKSDMSDTDKEKTEAALWELTFQR